MLVTLPSLISELQHALLPLKVLRAKKCAPIICFFCLQFGLTFETIKEFGGVSHGIRASVELDPLIGKF